eukprot:994504_1
MTSEKRFRTGVDINEYYNKCVNELLSKRFPHLMRNSNSNNANNTNSHNTNNTNNYNHTCNTNNHNSNNNAGNKRKKNPNHSSNHAPPNKKQKKNNKNNTSNNALSGNKRKKNHTSSRNEPPKKKQKTVHISPISPLQNHNATHGPFHQTDLLYRSATSLASIFLKAVNRNRRRNDKIRTMIANNSILSSKELIQTLFQSKLIDRGHVESQLEGNEFTIKGEPLFIPESASPSDDLSNISLYDMITRCSIPRNQANKLIHFFRDNKIQSSQLNLLYILNQRIMTFESLKALPSDLTLNNEHISDMIAKVNPDVDPLTQAKDLYFQLADVELTDELFNQLFVKKELKSYGKYLDSLTMLQCKICQRVCPRQPRDFGVHNQTCRNCNSCKSDDVHKFSKGNDTVPLKPPKWLQEMTLTELALCKPVITFRHIFQ